MLTRNAESSELEVPDGKSVLNFMGEQGWELVGPPDVTRMTAVTSAFNHVSEKQDHYIDYADTVGMTYIFKRELGE